MSNILLVESDRDMRSIYAEGLIRAGYDVTAANSAQSTLDALDELAIDLVVMEISLAVHNGIAIMYEMMSYHDWSQIPIIILTSVNPDNFQVDESVWRRLNVKKYLYKPDTRPAHLAGVVKEVLS